MNKARLDLTATLEAWLRDERARLSSAASVAEPIDYMLKRWHRFARFIDDGSRSASPTTRPSARAARLCPGAQIGGSFAGSERGADRAAAMATLIMTAKLNDVDPLAWLADVLARIAGIPAKPASTSCCLGNGSARRPLQLRRPDHYDAGIEQSSDGLREFLAVEIVELVSGLAWASSKAGWFDRRLGVNAVSAWIASRISRSVVCSKYLARGPCAGQKIDATPRYRKSAAAL